MTEHSQQKGDRLKSKLFVLIVLCVIAVACSSAPPVSQEAVEASAPPEELNEKTWQTVNWHVEEVRVSVLGELKASGNQGSNTAAGAVVGSGGAALLGATPAGIVASALVGGAAGSMIPIIYGDRQNTTCMIFVSLPSERVKKTFTWNSRDNPNEVGLCLNARSGDTFSVETKTHRRRNEYTYWKIAEDQTITKIDLLRP